MRYLSERMLSGRSLRCVAGSSQRSSRSYWHDKCRRVRGCVSSLALIASERVVRKELWAPVWYCHRWSLLWLWRGLLYSDVLGAGSFLPCSSLWAITAEGGSVGRLLSPRHVLNIRCICRHSQCGSLCAVVLSHDSRHGSPPCCEARLLANLQDQLVEVGAGITRIFDFSEKMTPLAWCKRCG